MGRAQQAPAIHLLRAAVFFWIALLFLPAVAGHAEESVHILKRGETIYTLARTYGVSADMLLSYNNITDPTRLPVGARIRIPGTYVVLDGEYIYAIARKLGVNWIELLAANNLDPDDVVRPGDVLVIPGAVSEPARVASGSVSDGKDGSNTEAKSDDSASGGESGETEIAPDTGRPSATQVVSAGLMWPHPGQREAYDGRFRGVAIVAQPGDEFRAVASGAVSYIAPFTSFGKVIFVQAANGYLYGYAGADRVDVQPGDRVDNGTVLGTVGISAAFQSARVLLSVWRDNRYVDPEYAPRG